MSSESSEVTQIEMIRIIKQFRQQGFQGKYGAMQRVAGSDHEYFVALTDAQTAMTGLFRIDLTSNQIEFQYMLDEDHVFAAD
ncbi:hypothetical protein [Lacticaseibacillus thailandensis]|uniref:PepSY domain-containing protein n=1 Tax=Lacticaseibacillus thailandensis DSM 22698 = JCM 13996 TaxID=1423810 RepID=A0A0R2C488_9LACO|nr:hypothetical protein [Lacticaseibacillus thailandensis]KRM86703.1 hypothetical protein FD19_GL001751 [Lacticaseibacillus thailandensis DSM 22698 = JCM 13996]